MNRPRTDSRSGSRYMQALTGAALVCALVTAGIADANTSRKADRAAAAKADSRSKRSAVRPPPTAARIAAGPVVVVDGTAADQAGYVHYFVITGPDGQPINHVGVE